MLAIIGNLIAIALWTYNAIKETEYRDRLTHVLLCVVFGSISFFILILSIHEIVKD